MKITNIKVRRILDSRGEETIELSLILNEKYEGKASVPMGKSVGSHEAICFDCEKIEKNLPTFLEEAKKFDFQIQKDLDQFLINYAGGRKEKLGANFTLAVSISFARALAQSKNQELYEYLRNEFYPNDNRIDCPNSNRIDYPDNNRMEYPNSNRINNPNGDRMNHPNNNRMDYPNDNRMDENSKIVLKDLSYKIMHIIFDIHRKLGTNFKENHYKNALEDYFKKSGINFEREKFFNAEIDGFSLGDLSADFVIENKIILEAKAKPFITKEDIRQTTRYLAALNLPLGIIVNFRRKKLEYKRIINPKIADSFKGDSFGSNSEETFGFNSGNNSGNSFGNNSGNLFGGNSGIIFGLNSGNLPKLMVNIIGGGVHSFNNLNFQEYWLVSKEGFGYELIGKILSIINQLERKLPKPLGRNEEGALCTNFENNLEPVKLLKEIVSDTFDLGIDVAANQVDLTIDELFQIYQELEKLEVKYLEDPFKEDDFEFFQKLREKSKIELIGDDLTATNPERLKIALEKNSVDGVIVKPNQIGTILETFEFVKLAKENNLFTIFSHRSGETNDDWIIDLGIAFLADFFKIGPPLQGERVAKYNRLLEIVKIKL